jgi:hypothetical protein
MIAKRAQTEPQQDSNSRGGKAKRWGRGRRFLFRNIRFAVRRRFLDLVIAEMRPAALSL